MKATGELVALEITGGCVEGACGCVSTDSGVLLFGWLGGGIESGLKYRMDLSPPRPWRKRDEDGPGTMLTFERYVPQFVASDG